MLKTFLIDRLCKTKSFIVIDLETGTDYFIALVFVKNSFHNLFLLFAPIRVIRGQTPSKIKTPFDLRQTKGGTRIKVSALALGIIIVVKPNRVHKSKCDNTGTGFILANCSCFSSFVYFVCRPSRFRRRRYKPELNEGCKGQYRIRPFARFLFQSRSQKEG